MTTASSLKIGLFAIGLDSYWEQFEGLKEKLDGYLDTVYRQIAAFHPDIVNAGMVDNIDKAFDAGKLFRQQDVDIIFLYVSTYALSATVLPVVHRAKRPVVILNISPGPAIDYVTFNALANRTQMTGEWLAHCSPCPVPEIANVFKRTGIPFFQVTGTLHEEDMCWQEAGEWVQSAKVAQMMSMNRMGCMGHYYSGMLDIYTDLTQQVKYFGGHFEMIEVDELCAARKTVSGAAAEAMMEEFRKRFAIDPACSPGDLQKAAKTAVALDLLVDKYKLGSLAYYYKGSGNSENEETINSIILGNSLLTAKGIPVAGEYEIKNAQAMKIMDGFGAGGSFTEYYAMDFKEDIVLMGHDGPGHIGIAEGNIRVKPLEVYHGKVGKGLSVEMSVRNGPVTLLSVVEKPNAALMFLVAHATTVPGAILEIGNTNSRYRFPIGAVNFVESWNSFGPAHHCAVGIGHIAEKIRKLGNLLNIETVQVC